MSLRREVVANYASQFYVTAAGIVVVPIYLRYLGAEAYGLVGVFALLQAWFQMLDMGLSPTLAREVARFRGGQIDALELCTTLRALEIVFLGIAGLGTISMVVGSDWIATQWLRAQQLPEGLVSSCLTLMSLAVPLRWMSGLYRGAVNGFERQVWLAGFNSVIATLRFPGAIAAMTIFGSNPLIFFAYQLALALVEVGLLVGMSYRLLPAAPGRTRRLSWESLGRLGQFSGAVAITGMIWICITQFDRLLLSRYLPLTDFGYFTLAVTVANAVMLLSAPMAQILMPRLARLHAQGDTAQMLAIYRRATRVVAALVSSAGLFLATFSERLLWVWTGDAHAAHAAAPVLALYAVGNACVAMAAFAYYLQFGFGTLRMHLIGNIGLALVMLPCIWWAAGNYGAVAVGTVWLAAMVTYLVLWVGITHRKLVPGLHAAWFLWDVLPPFVAAATLAAVLGSAVPSSPARGETFAALSASVLAMVAVSAAAAWLVHRRVEFISNCRP